MQHIKRESGGVVIYDAADWRAGLGPQGKFESTQSLKQSNENGFVTMVAIDPFASYGVLAPGVAASANVTNSANLAGPIVDFQVKDNTVVYGIDTGGKLHTIDYIANSISASRTLPVTSPVGQNLMIYKHNSGGTATNSLFYSYYVNANFDIGCYIGLATFDDDFMSTVPATPLDITTGDGDDATQRTQPHVMEVGADDIMYIGSGRYLHAYDGATGTNGTFSSKVLTLPAGFQITALKKTGEELLIVGNYYSTSSAGIGKALCYRWNYRDLDVSQVIDLEDYYVSACFLWKGTPAFITQGIVERNGAIKVKVLSGSSVEKLADFDGVIPLNTGVVVVNDVIYLNAGGKIIAVGNKYMKGSRAVTHIATFSQPGTSGAMFYNTTGPYLAGSAAQSTSYCFNNINNGHGSASAVTYYFSPEFAPGKMGKLKAISVEFEKPLAAGGTNGNLSMSIATDANSESRTFIANKSSVVVPLMKRYTLSTTGLELPTFCTFRITTSWAGSTAGVSPAISRILVEYDTINSNVSV